MVKLGGRCGLYTGVDMGTEKRYHGLVVRRLFLYTKQTFVEAPQDITRAKAQGKSSLEVECRNSVVRKQVHQESEELLCRDDTHQPQSHFWQHCFVCFPTAKPLSSNNTLVLELFVVFLDIVLFPLLTWPRFFLLPWSSLTNLAIEK